MRKAAVFAIPVLALTAMAAPLLEPLWQGNANVLIMKGGANVTRSGVEFLECTIHNLAGEPIGAFSTPVAVQDFASPVTIETSVGTLSGTHGSILNDGISADAALGVMADSVNGKKYVIFSGTTRVGGSGDWYGTGAYASVETIIWRCKYELEADANGEIVIEPVTGGPKLVSCLYCVCALVRDELPL